MSTREDLIKIIDGEVMVNGTMILLMNADVAYCHTDVAESGREKARAFLEQAYREMRATGYKHTDILETVLLQNSSSERAVDMAIEAMDLMGTEGLMRSLRAAGFNPNMAKGNSDAN